MMRETKIPSGTSSVRLHALSCADVAQLHSTMAAGRDPRQELRDVSDSTWDTYLKSSELKTNSLAIESISKNSTVVAVIAAALRVVGVVMVYW